jgi:ankyrin repeat protein
MFFFSRVVLSNEQPRGRVNILDEDSRTPLYQACLMGSLPMAKMLLAADADPNLAGRGSSLRPQAEEEMEDGAAKAGAGVLKILKGIPVRSLKDQSHQ